MARIVCQVSHRADQTTFLWSDGSASFEPYHLEGPAHAELMQLAGQIQAQLATASPAELATLGHRLYRLIFCLDASDTASQAAHGWVQGQLQASIEKIEILSDSPGLIPWNVLIDTTTGEVATQFWGARFSIAAGRRVNPLRQTPVFEMPNAFAAIDGDFDQPGSPLIAQLRDAGKLVYTTTSLADEVAKSTPDVLWLSARFERGRIRLGADALDLAGLRSWIDHAQAGNPEPIVILSVSGAVTDQAAWTSLLASASALFSGLIANEALLPVPQASAIGHNIARQFLDGKRDLGTILRNLRAEHGGAALAFSAFCPPQIRVCAPEAEDAPLPENTVELHPLPLRPYHPFAAYDATERALFTGRDLDVQRAAAILDRADTQGIVLHGAPGVGKTSFLQAGLLPYLEQECIGYRVLRDRTPADAPAAEKDYPILILRTTSDLIGQFADALSTYCAQPYSYMTPVGASVTVDLPSLLQLNITGLARPSAVPTAIQDAAANTGISASPTESHGVPAMNAADIWSSLRENPALLGKTLNAITAALPFGLVIAIDQGEELLTLVRTKSQEESRRQAVAMLQGLADAAPRCKFVFTMRSQSLGEFIHLFPHSELPAGWRTHYLRPLTEEEMLEALTLPTNRTPIPYASEIPFPQYGFAFEEGLAQTIVRSAITTGVEHQMSPLPIMHAAGSLLYDKQVLEKKQNVLRADHLKEFVGVGEALDKALDHKVKQLRFSPNTENALKTLINSLAIRQSDGTLTRDLIPDSDLPQRWHGSTDKVETAVNQAADQQGLFEIQNLLIDGRNELYISLPQDSLAHLGKRIETQRELKKTTRSNTADVLWIMIPMVFLAAAVTFWFTRTYLTSAAADPREEQSNEKLAAMQGKQLGIETTRRPLYHGMMAQAAQAWQAENVLRTRQLLLSQPALHAFNEVVDEKRKPADIRGFEWRYLWKQINNERFLLAGHRGGVTAVAVSPDGKWAASASERSEVLDDAAIRIWNLANGEIVAKIAGPNTAVLSLAFAPDSKSLATASADKLVRVYELPDLKPGLTLLTKEPKSLQGHEGAINAVVFGKDAQTLASAGADKTLIIWDMQTGKARHTLKDHTAKIQALAFHAGKLVSAGAEADYIVWDADAGKKLQAIKTAYQTITSLGISADGKTLCTGGVETKFDTDLGTVRFWALDTGKESAPAIQHGSGVFAVALHPDGKSVASGGSDHIIRFWDVATGKQQQRRLGHLGAVHALAYAKDGSALLSGSVDRTVKVWNTYDPDVVAAHADWVQCLALNAKNTMVASGSRDGSVKLWDVAGAKLLHQLAAHTGAVTSLSFSHHKDKSYLAVGTRTEKNEGAIKVWLIETDAKTGVTAKEKATLKDHTKGVNTLAFTPNADQPNLLVSGSADQTVKLWDIESGKEKETFRGHKDEVRSISFAPDGRSFASGGKDANICIHELATKTVWTLTDVHLGSIDAISFFGLRLGEGPGSSAPAIWTGSSDQTTRISIFSLADGGRVEDKRELRRFRAHSQGISSVVQSELPLGMMATASWDGSIKLYDVNHERYTLLGHQGPVRALVLANDQSFLVSAGHDGTVRFWRAPKERNIPMPEKLP